MKRRVFAFVLAALLLLLFSAASLAIEVVTIEASPQRVQAGETVAVSGTAAENELLSIKVTDNEGSILYFNAVRAGSDGSYHDSFIAPDVSPRTLIVVAGSGSTVAVAQVTLFIQQYCTVTFNKNGGDAEATPQAVTVKEGQAITSLPAPPKKDGHTFSGWFLEKECKTTWSGSDSVTTDIRVFAGWTAKTYTVIFFEPDGKTQIGQTQTVSWGGAAKIVAAPLRNGHRFDRWMLSGDDETVPTSLENVRENIGATASYIKIGGPAPTSTVVPPPAPTAKPTINPVNTPIQTPTAQPSASAAVTVSPTASAKATPGTTPVVTVAATSAPSFATPNTNSPILPCEIKDDKKKGIITVVIHTDDLPEGTAAVQLPDGRVVDVSGGDTVIVEIKAEDLDESGRAHFTAIDDEGIPLGNLAVEAPNHSGISILAVVLLSMGVLFIMGFVLFIVNRRKRSR